MKPKETQTREDRRPARTALRLEDLIPIAVAVAAGCESCAERTVRRAVDEGSSKGAIARTLAIVAHVRSLNCFAEAVGAQVVARMEAPLRAGERALAGAPAAAGEAKCCG